MTLSTERIRSLYGAATSWRMDSTLDRPDLEELREKNLGEFDAWLAGYTETVREAERGRMSPREALTQIECPHWSPGHITLRKGCTSCEAERKQAEARITKRGEDHD